MTNTEVPMVTEEEVMGFVQKLAGYMIGGAVVAGVQLGDRLGIYAQMAGAGWQTSNQIAAGTNCHPRLVREWLDGQVAAGLLDFEDDGDRYALSTPGAMTLADTNSPVFLARGMQVLSSFSIDLDAIEAAYRGDGGLAWGDHHQCLFDGVEWFFRTGYRAHLAAEWIPSLDGVESKLVEGARVLDVGCGHGASVVAMAEAFPNSEFVGIDYHQPSIETARERAVEAGVEDRCRFDVADAKSYDGEYDLIAFFDCLHDMGDPVGAAAHARSRLRSGGSVLLVEPFALDERTTNIAENPFAAMNYVASSMVCTPNSLSQEVGRGLGAQAGESVLREVFEEAGFDELVRRTETPFNLILQAR